MRRIATLAFLVVDLAACNREQSMFAPAGPAAAGLATLGQILLGVSSVVAVVVSALIVIAALKRRGTLEEHAAWDTGGGYRWLFIGGIAVPVIILGGFFIVNLLWISRYPLHDGEAHAPDIRITGHQWWWQVDYLGSSPDRQVTMANEIHIPVGQPVNIALESSDVIHSFWVPRLHGKVDLIPGRANHIRIEASEPGIYEGQCSEYCGMEHARMRLIVVAEPREAFAKWMTAQAAPAAPPETEQARAGQRLFEERACSLCHTIRGTEAKGSIGPDLTHIASRRGIAANSLPNTHAYLSAWIVRAQSLKPGARMPNITDFTGEQLDALSLYLLGLR